MTADIATIGLAVDTRQVRQADRDLDTLDRTGRKVASTVDDINRQIASMAKAMSLVKDGLIFGTIAKTVYEVSKSLVEAQIQLEKFNNTLRMITGSAAGAAREMAYIRDISNKMGLELVSTANAYSKLNAAARETSLQGRGAKAVFESVSMASTALGLSAEETSGALLALTQMVSKGTVQAEELRGQLGERLPGAFQIAARAMGVSTSELGKMLEQGRVLADDFLPKFAKQLREEMGPAAMEAAKGTQAATNRMKTSWEELKMAVADSGYSELMTGQLNILRDAFDDIAKSIRDAKKEGSGFWGQMWAGAKGAGRFLNPVNAFSYSAQGKEARLNEDLDMLVKLDQQLQRLEDTTGKSHYQVIRDTAEARKVRAEFLKLQGDLAKIAQEGMDMMEAERGMDGELSRLHGRDPKVKQDLMDKLKKDFMPKFSDKAKMNKDLEDFKTTYGILVGTTEYADGIKAIIAKHSKGDAKIANADYHGAIAGLEAYQRLEKEVLSGQMDDIESRYKRGEISLQEYTTRKLDIQLQALDTQKGIVEKEAELATHKKDKANIEKFNGELKVLQQVRVNMLAATENEIAEQQAEATKKQEEEFQKRLAIIKDQTAQVEIEVDAYERLPSVLTGVKIRREQERLAALQQFEGSEKVVEQIREEILAMQDLAKAQDRAEKNDQKHKDAKKKEEEAQRTIEAYDDIFRKGFSDMLNHGKDAWKSFTRSLATTFKTSFADELYKMFAQKFIVNVVGNMTGIVSGIASSIGNAGSSLIGNAANAMGLASGMSKLYDWGGSALGALGFGTGAMGTLGATGISATAGTGLSLASAGGGLGLSAGTGTGLSLASGSSIGVTGASAGAGALGGTGAATSAAGGGLGSSLAAAAPYAAIALIAYGIWKSLDHSGTPHMGSASRADQFGVAAIDGQTLGTMKIQQSADMQKVTDSLATGISTALNSTAKAFGKEAGYAVATAFADDSSKDGAWGALKIMNAAGTAMNWDDNRKSRWAPREYGDGQEGYNQYLTDLAQSTRTALEEIGLPKWAKNMLEALGSAPSMEQLSQTVDKINAAQTSLIALGKVLSNIANLNDSTMTSLVEMFGTVDNLTNSISFFNQNFLSEGERIAPVMAEVRKQMSDLGYASVDTKDEFKNLVKGLDLTDDAQRKLFGSLMTLAPAFLQVADYTAKAQEQINAATGAGASIEKRTQAIEDARQKVENAYRAESSALQDLYNKHAAFAKAAREFAKELTTGNLSPLSPEQKYQQLKSEFDRTYSLAKAGDPDAQGKLQGVAQSFLEASKGFYASTEQYVKDFDMVKSAMESAADAADTQASLAKQQLDKLAEMVDGIIKVDDSVQSLKDALSSYMTVINGLAAPATGYGTAGGYAGPSSNQGATSGLSAVQTLYSKYSSLAYMDDEGGAYWASRFNSGAPLSQIEQEFKNSVTAVTGRQFAEGGIFTNGVVSQPTMFNMAEMGEAGPEAIMPLVRTARGLAVRSVGGDMTDPEIKALLREVLQELRAANVQRGEAAVSQIEVLEEVKRRIEKGNRQAARQIA